MHKSASETARDTYPDLAHFRFDQAAGTVQGRAVGLYVCQNLRPISGDGGTCGQEGARVSGTRPLPILELLEDVGDAAVLYDRLRTEVQSGR